jgi:hypothetical protein
MRRSPTCYPRTKHLIPAVFLENLCIRHAREPALTDGAVALLQMEDRGRSIRGAPARD